MKNLILFIILFFSSSFSQERIEDILPNCTQTDSLTLICKDETGTTKIKYLSISFWVNDDETSDLDFNLKYGRDLNLFLYILSCTIVYAMNEDTKVFEEELVIWSINQHIPEVNDITNAFYQLPNNNIKPTIRGPL